MFTPASERGAARLERREDAVHRADGFVDRYDALSAGDSKYGAEGKQAAEVLVERGITPAVAEEARTLLALLVELEPIPAAASLDQQRVELEKAEVALWAWYLEWARIARVAINQRALPKQLGFLATRKGGEDEGEAPDGSFGAASKRASGRRSVEPSHGGAEQRFANAQRTPSLSPGSVPSLRARRGGCNAERAASSALRCLIS